MNKQKGFIGLLVLILVALALLKYLFNWSIFDAAASEEGRGTISYLRDIINLVWHYIGAPLRFIWSNILLPLLDLTWRAFQAFLTWGRGVGGN